MKKLRYIMLGFLLGIMTFASFLVYSDSSSMKQIEVFFKGIQVTYNGNHVTLENEPFIYNARIYFTAKDMANLFNKNIKWNEVSNTAEVTDVAPVIAPSPEKAQSGEARIAQTPDGIQVDYYEGKNYVGIGYIMDKYKSKGFAVGHEYYDPEKHDGKTLKYQLYKDNKLILDEIPTFGPYGYDSVEYQYYIDNILPLLNE